MFGCHVLFCFFFMQKLISNFTNTAAGQKLEKSESIFNQQWVFFSPPLLLIYSFWNLWLKQICVKSSAGAVEKAFWLIYNLQQLYLKAPASHTIPLLLPPPWQSLPENVDFSSFWKNKSSVIKTFCLGCLFYGSG